MENVRAGGDPVLKRWLVLLPALSGCVDFDDVSRCYGGLCGDVAGVLPEAGSPGDGGLADGEVTDAAEPSGTGVDRAGAGIKPDETNTGVPRGTRLDVVDHDVTVTVDGTVIDAQDIHGFLTIQASDVKITRSVVRGRPVEGRAAAIRVASGTNVVIEDTEIAIATPSAAVQGLVARAVTARRLHIHGASEGVTLSGSSRLEFSFVHDLLPVTAGVNRAVVISGGSGIHVTGNRLVVSREQGAALLASQDLPIDGLVIESNWADGGGCTFNFAHRTYGSLTVTVQANRFGGNTLFANCPILKSTKTELLGTGNVWDDTGEPVPIQSHD